MITQDPRFPSVLLELLRRQQTFAVATVVSVRGSASGKPGARALFDDRGRNIHGWVGGGCVERFAGEQAVEAMADGKPRVVVADLDDEIMGLGMPCGGTMDIYIEPVCPRPPLMVVGDGPIARHLVSFASQLGMRVIVHAPDPLDVPEDELVSTICAPYEACEPPVGARVVVASRHRGDDAGLTAGLRAEARYLGLVANRSRGAAVRERLSKAFHPERVASLRSPAGLDLGGRQPAEIAISVLAEVLAEERGVEVGPLDRQAGPGPWSSISEPWPAPALLVVGHSRIGEALARLATSLQWPITMHAASPTDHQRSGYPDAVRWVTGDPGFARMPASPSTAVVVASHHKGDEQAIATALAAGAPYVGLIASGRRSAIIRERLPASVTPAARMLRAPAGLALGAIGPGEIALSVVAEILALRHGRSGRPLASLEQLPPRRGGPCPDACGDEP